MLIEKNRPLTWSEKLMVTYESIWHGLGALALVGGFLFALQATFRYGTKTFWYLGQVLGRREAESLLVIIVAVVSMLAYALKRQCQGWYGLIEIVFGLAAATNIAFSMLPGSSTLPQWLTLFGCTYIIVRGIGNVTEALERLSQSAKRANDLATEPPSDASSALAMDGSAE